MNKLHKPFLFIVIGLVVAGAILTIIQMWGNIVPWDVFIKIVITIGILTVLFGFLLVVGSDLGQHKKMKDENYLD